MKLSGTGMARVISDRRGNRPEKTTARPAQSTCCGVKFMASVKLQPV